MKKITTTVLATMIALCGYSQDLPLTAGSANPLTGDLHFSGNRTIYWDNNNYIGTAPSTGNQVFSATNHIFNGTLKGTSAAFSGSVDLNTVNVSKYATGGLKLQSPAGGVSMYSYTDGGGAGWTSSADGGANYSELIYLNRNSSLINLYTGGNLAATFSAANTILNGALTGTSATFTGSVDLNTVNVSKYATGGLKLQSPAGGVTMYSYTDGGGAGWTSSADGGANYSELIYLNRNSSQINLYTGGNLAATFSAANTTLNGALNGTSATFTNHVAIGTPQADANLSVKGKLRAKEIKVELDVLPPDYVFEKEYDLKSLPEVEKYITENKHLPEIPSAKTMTSDGVNVGEMQMKLLQKIEELTLHLIEQDKKLKKQEQLIDLLIKKQN